MQIQIIYFSGTGRTKKLLEGLKKGFNASGDVCMVTDLNEFGVKSEPQYMSVELILFVMPVYQGRIPSFVSERLKDFDGTGRKVAVAVTYGCRDYDDALLELSEICQKAGATVIGAAAFPTEHNIYPKLGEDRPNPQDLELAAGFCRNLIKKLDDSTPVKVPGNKPYKKITVIKKLMPKGDASCIKCGKCVVVCPVGAIDSQEPTKTIESLCITCLACTHVCAVKSRKISKFIRFMTGLLLRKYRKVAKSPEFFMN